MKIFQKLFFYYALMLLPLEGLGHNDDGIALHKQIAHEISYMITCRLIDLKHFLLEKKEIFQTKCAQNNPNAIKNLISKIKTELDTLKYNALDQEIKALLAIKAKFAIPNARWNEYIGLRDTIKEYNLKKLSDPIEYPPLHDPQLSSNISKKLTKMLKKNGINPSAVYLKKGLKKTNHLAHSIVYLNDESTKNFKKPKIVLFEKALQAPKEHLIAICAHEIEHVIQQHKVTKKMVLFCVKEHTQLPYADITNSTEYQQLIAAHEAQAEILSALKNPKIAHCMKKLRQTRFYPNYLYSRHYDCLAYIDKLWQMYTKFNKSENLK